MEQGALPPEARADLDTAIPLTLVALILEAVFLALGAARPRRNRPCGKIAAVVYLILMSFQTTPFRHDL